MTNEAILMNNKFSECNKEELEQYWNEMKDFYKNGWISDGAALEKMRDWYCDHYTIGISIMERDLLRAIACKFFEEST